jgi:hypothetical protein
MGTNIHARHRDKSGHTTPPSGHDDMTDESHALRAGKKGPTQRKHALKKEEPTRGVRSEESRSETGKS